jgi:hypothetical protein
MIYRYVYRMDSFLGLFDPGSSSSDEGWESSHSSDSPMSRDVSEFLAREELMMRDDLCFSDQLPPEPQLGNVEYKLKLVNPSRQRFEHLVTQVTYTLVNLLCANLYYSYHKKLNTIV